MIASILDGKRRDEGIRREKIMVRVWLCIAGAALAGVGVAIYYVFKAFH